MGMVFHTLVYKNNPSLSECHDDFFIQEPGWHLSVALAGVTVLTTSNPSCYTIPEKLYESPKTQDETFFLWSGFLQKEV
jgi:hypothetical protein